MKRILIITLLAAVTSGKAQLTLQPVVPASGMIQKDQLWNISIVNSTTEHYQCRIGLVLKDRVTNTDIVTATSNIFNLDPGPFLFNINGLSPVQYNYISYGFDTRLQGLLPVGNYIACYSLTSVGTKDYGLAEECVQFDAEPLSPPMLIFPADSAVLDISPSQFSWIPPAPAGMFANLQYDVIIAPINEGQKADEAIQENIPFLAEGNHLNSMLNYPSSAPAFEVNKWYAWQVVARDERTYAGKTETWVFKVVSKDVSRFVSTAPYIKMQKTSKETGIAPEGILKLSYVNETSQRTSRILIFDQSMPSDKALLTTIEVNINGGENLISYDLNKRIRLQEGKVYTARIVNSRNEKWEVQFVLSNYSDTKH